MFKFGSNDSGPADETAHNFSGYGSDNANVVVI